MSEKKRKSSSADDVRPNKKQQVAGKVTVTHIESTGSLQPIVGATPGANFPSDIKFRSYLKKTPSNPSKLLLHSTEHPTINFTASEGDTSINDHLKHYIAVFDPATGQLQVTEAKHLNVRSSIRGTQSARDDDEDVITPVTNYSSKAALTQAFGTKKSKKAVQSIAENRLLAQGDEEADNPVSAAMFSNIPEEQSNADGAIDAAALANKPIPQPNLTTNEIDQVYAVRNLVNPYPTDKTLAAMPINAWVKVISSKGEVFVSSRFVANRVGYLTKMLIASPEASDPNLKRNLQILRYILLLLDIHKYAVTLPRRRPVPPVSKWPDTVFAEETPMSLLSGILPRFFTGDKLPTTHALTLIRTTILALTLHIPPPSGHAGQATLATEITDISLDMAIDSSEIRKLFRELGCKVEPASEKELLLWGLEKMSHRKKKDKKSQDSMTGGSGGGGGSKPMFAKLTFPLNFPKVSRGQPKGRR